MLDKLIEVCFKKVGDWSLVGHSLRLTLASEENSQNVLYCLVVDENPMYIGKTVQPLKKRMYGYLRPGPSQSTNIKNNAHLTNALLNGSKAELFVLPDNGLLHLGAFHLNLAAGLEDSIVRKLCPEWNLVGKGK
ncbi:MAG: GIY-YIG nuclease family protein [Flavobacteriaceae bacterium]|nr:GIY-YIG nuclease family protein [Flavobacteriaceae bacterium]